MIDPAFGAMLRSRYSIRRFFLLYGAILVATLLILMLAAALETSSTLRTVGIAFLGNFAAADAIFMLAYGFYVFVTPPGLRNATLLPLRSGEIAEGVIDLRKDATDYWFWGRGGGYLRTDVLPRLDELARKERRHINVRIVVPDPKRPGSAARYAAMIRGLGEAADDSTPVANVVATVVAAVRASARNPYLHAEIGLSATVPVLRYDLSTSGGLITRDAPTLPAILVNAGTPYFEMLKDAVENELGQSQKITWDESSSVFRQAGDISIEDALPAIRGLPKVDQTVIATAESLLLKGHRYAR